MHYLVILTSIAHILGTFAYIKNTFLGHTQPNRVTYFFWAAVPMIAAAAGLAEGATWAMLPVFMSGLGPLLVLIASFFNRRAYWKLGPLDWICGALTAGAVAAWVLTKDPTSAVVLAIIADAFALLPTLIKAWKFPETETGLGYLGMFSNNIAGLLVATTWSFLEVGFLIYLLIANGLLSFGIYRHGFFSRVRKELFLWK